MLFEVTVDEVEFSFIDISFRFASKLDACLKQILISDFHFQSQIHISSSFDTLVGLFSTSVGLKH